MMNIEQLAIEHGITITHNGYAGETDLLNVETAKAFAKAFAKALQQKSEPVGYISEDGLKDLKKGFYGVSIFEYSNFRKVPVFTQPPNTVQQQSEPFIYINKEDWKKGKLDWCTLEYKKSDCDNFKHRYTMPLFTQPPNTVGIEQYNKLERELSIAKDVLEAHTLTHVYDRIIAEAERSEK